MLVHDAGVQCEKVNSKKLDLKSFSTKDGAEIQSGSGKSQWIHLKRGCTGKTTGSATVIFDTIPGETYQLEFEASVTTHNADNKKDDFSTGHLTLNGLDKKFHIYKVFSTFNSKIKNEKWDPIVVHVKATGKKTTVFAWLLILNSASVSSIDSDSDSIALVPKRSRMVLRTRKIIEKGSQRSL